MSQIRDIMEFAEQLTNGQVKSCVQPTQFPHYVDDPLTQLLDTMINELPFGVWRGQLRNSLCGGYTSSDETSHSSVVIAHYKKPFRFTQTGRREMQPHISAELARGV